jgi:hypothetical protein
MKIVKMYDTWREAVATVQALEAAGIPHHRLSIVANTGNSPDTIDHAREIGGAAPGAAVGAAVGGGAGLLAGLGMLAIPGIGPVVAAGWLVATLTGAAVGGGAGAAAGSLVSALTHHGVADESAQLYAEGVRRGGVLVSVEVDDNCAEEAAQILEGSSAVDINARAAAYRSSGWEGFPPPLS